MDNITLPLLLLCVQMILLYQDPKGTRAFSKTESSEDRPAKHDLELEERQPEVCLSDVSYTWVASFPNFVSKLISN